MQPVLAQPPAGVTAAYAEMTILAEYGHRPDHRQRWELPQHRRGDDFSCSIDADGHASCWGDFNAATNQPQASLTKLDLVITPALA